MWLWPYLTGTVAQPVPATVVLLGGSALWFGVLVALMSVLLRHGRAWSAVVAVANGTERRGATSNTGSGASNANPGTGCSPVPRCHSTADSSVADAAIAGCLTW